MRFTLTFSLVFTLAALGAGAPSSPGEMASEGEPLAKRPNFKIIYRGASKEAEAASLAKRPNFKIIYRGAAAEAEAETGSLAKRPNFKIIYRGAADEDM
ncbi:hypothetical protein OCS_02253 [Ophiocordyceps sinensis CO18]|uniref:Uncharacterized protein n=1 Tax=Ophiocordyceps sinensis (strain Co18 / CGMCC 3.14243) TaxID=911162 RepID=T5AJM3_OPHSC|nr:hypothetical protein OCS_02253 [Ophiocordyceps sinensis CO18]